ncbi:MAG TPA: hypothetical protein VFA44_09375 [Gaiellaceae bacterium]|nr:hypothetical protein [Gaiellaceae bacterium]
MRTPGRRRQGRPAIGLAALAALLAALAASTAGAVAPRPPVLARDLARSYFGSALVRAEVVSVIGGVMHDFRIDEGRVTAVRPGAIDLLERDGTRQTVPVGPVQQLTPGVGGLLQLGEVVRGVRVVTVRDGDRPAAEVRLAAAVRALGRVLFGATLARAEVISVRGRVVDDVRIDQGRILQTGPAGVVLLELDGSRVAIRVAQSTVVTGPAGLVTFGARGLQRGMTVVAVRSDSLADEIRVVGIRGRG